MLHHQLAWYVGGPVLGLCVVAIRLLLGERLGVSGAYGELIDRLAHRSLAFGWRGWFAIGLVAGAAGFALIAGGPDFHGYGWLTDTFHGSGRILVAVLLVLAGVLIGFGAWSGLASPEKSYLFLFFASAVATAFVGLRIVRALRTRAVLTSEPVRWAVQRPQRRHIEGSLLFGLGWGIADVCPGPALAQLGQGVAWSIFTLVGIALGAQVFQRRRRVA